MLTTTKTEIPTGASRMFEVCIFDNYIEVFKFRVITDNGDEDTIALRAYANYLYPGVKSSEQISKDLEAAVDQHIESVAHADRWESRVTCTMRAGYPNPWQNKAIAFGQWMDACYTHCIQVQAAVIAGTRPVPTETQLIAELPIMVWPA